MKSIVNDIRDRLINIRRELHKYPELATREYKTYEIILRELRKIQGIKIYENMAEGTGLVAILEGKNKGGKCVLLRGDIDGLPIEEEIECEFKSRNIGNMHACGHDMHITWVLGCAMALSKLKDTFSGTVKFIFQPGEEQGFGAKALIEKNNVLENPKVDIAFAAHIWPSIESGKIAIPSKYAFACPGSFHIDITGVGGHAAWPHECINPIIVANKICENLQYISSTMIKSTQPNVISVASINGGEKGISNIIPNTCSISGTFRAMDMDVMRKIEKEIKNTSTSISSLYGAKCKSIVDISGDSVKNCTKLVEFSHKIINKVLGEKSCEIIENGDLGGENFSEFSSRVSSCYLFIGNKRKEDEKNYGLHSSWFSVDESVLENSVIALSSIILEYLTVEID